MEYVRSVHAVTISKDLKGYHDAMLGWTSPAAHLRLSNRRTQYFSEISDAATGKIDCPRMVGPLMAVPEEARRGRR